MAGITDTQWRAYESTINDAHNFFNQANISWFRFSHGLQRYGEDTPSIDHYTEIVLKGLIAFNVFRTWPMSDETITGKLDKESMVLILNNKYLVDNGYMSPDNNFEFDPGKDYFIYQGQKLTSSGETPASQTKSYPLHTMLILKREPTITGENKY